MDLKPIRKPSRVRMIGHVAASSVFVSFAYEFFRLGAPARGWLSAAFALVWAALLGAEYWLWRTDQRRMWRELTEAYMEIEREAAT